MAHLLWGPDIFVALYDCPDLVHSVLDLVTTTYIAWLTHWKELAEEGNEFTAHWAMMMRGGTMVRDDTPVMLSGAQYDEFARPYDQRVLDAFGGCIHFLRTRRPVHRLGGHAGANLYGRQHVSAPTGTMSERYGG